MYSRGHNVVAIGLVEEIVMFLVVAIIELDFPREGRIVQGIADGVGGRALELEYVTDREGAALLGAGDDRPGLGFAILSNEGSGLRRRDDNGMSFISTIRPGIKSEVDTIHLLRRGLNVELVVLPSRNGGGRDELVSIGNESEAAGDRIEFNLHHLRLDNDLRSRRETLSISGSEPDGEVRSQRGIEIFRLGSGPQIKVVARGSRIEEGVVVVVVVLAHLPGKSSVRKIAILGIKGRTNKLEDVTNGKGIARLGTDNLGQRRSIVGIDTDSGLGAAALAVLDNQLGVESTRFRKDEGGLGLGRIESAIALKVPLESDLVAIGIVTTSTIECHR